MNTISIAQACNVAFRSFAITAVTGLGFGLAMILTRLL